MTIGRAYVTRPFIRPTSSEYRFTNSNDNDNKNRSLLSFRLVSWKLLGNLANSSPPYKLQQLTI